MHTFKNVFSPQAPKPGYMPAKNTGKEQLQIHVHTYFMLHTYTVVKPNGMTVNGAKIINRDK